MSVGGETAEPRHRPESAPKARGQHTGMKVHGTSRMIGEAPDADTRQPTTLDHIYNQRTANAQMTHQIGHRITQLIERLDGADARLGADGDGPNASQGRLNDLLEDIRADGNRLSEILADLDRLDALL